MTELTLPRLSDDPDAPFPDTRGALRRPNGLLAWGGDLHPRRLLAAYRRGIFPWSGPGEPLLWWTPSPRCVLLPGGLRISRRLARTLRQRRHRFTSDRAFGRVIRGCAAPRDGQRGTWITPGLVAAFEDLHARGHAHSVEVWRDQHLVGGLYGLALGRVFFAESMFFSERDASKLAMVGLDAGLRQLGFELVDCQVDNPHLRRMGASLMDRAGFEAVLEDAVGDAGRSRWDAVAVERAANASAGVQ